MDQTARARHHLERINKALEIHNELERDRKKLEGEHFDAKPLQVKIDMPGLELVDNTKEQKVVSVDQEGMNVTVLQIGTKHNDLLSISLYDVVALSICGREIQQKMMAVIKSPYEFQPKFED